MYSRRNFLKTLSIGSGLFLLPWRNAFADATPSGPLVAMLPSLPKDMFVTICCHDVRDDVLPDVDSDPYAINTRNLIALFDWFKANKWHSLSVQQIIDARSEKFQIEKNSFHISFDDGLESFYSKVFPLLKAYNYSAVHALETNWIERTHEHQPVHYLQNETLLHRRAARHSSAKSARTPDQVQYDVSQAHHSPNLVMPGKIDYNGMEFGAPDFVTWEQVQEMHASGLVEFASHTHRSHHGILANPQGNEEAATYTRQYLAHLKRYESDHEFHDRLYLDFQQSTDTIHHHLGVRPRVLVWPFGAATPEVNEIAKEAGMPVTFSLYSRTLTHIKQPTLSFGRLLMINDPMAMDIVANIQDVLTPAPAIERVLQVALDDIYDESPKQINRNLSVLLNQVKAMGVSTIYLQAFADPDGTGNAAAMYFRNRVLPMRGDIFNRVAWQLISRCGVHVYALMPLLAFTLPNIQEQQALAVKIQNTRGEIVPSPRKRQRLSPFLPESLRLVTMLYEDLAKSQPAISGVVIGDDAYLDADEDATASTSAALWPGNGKPVSYYPLTPDEKTQALIEFGKMVTERMQYYTNVSQHFSVARNIYARVITHPETQGRFAMAMAPFLENYDWVALEAMPYLDGTTMPPDAWLRKLAAKVAHYDHALNKTVFLLQARNWAAKKWIPAVTIKKWLDILERHGVLNIGICPDDFLSGHPSFQETYEGFSLHRFPARGII